MNSRDGHREKKNPEVKMEGDHSGGSVGQPP